MSYAALAWLVDRQGFALRNLASLPHISVAGACATATHGSGLANQNLAASITGVDLVTAAGDLVELGPADDSFAGAVVHLGALGVVARLILAVVPSFEVSQWVYEDLPLEVLDDHFADIMSSGYSVSMFTDWRGPRLTQIWVKQRVDDPAPRPPASLAEAPWFTAAPAPPGGTRCRAGRRRPAPSSWASPAVVSAAASFPSRVHPERRRRTAVGIPHACRIRGVGRARAGPDQGPAGPGAAGLRVPRRRRG